MFKKSIALFLTALMILSCFTPALALTLEELPLVIIAQEDFADYLAKYDENGDGEATESTGNKPIKNAYPSSAATGYGWAYNWSSSATEYAVVPDTVKLYNQATNGNMIKLDGMAKDTKVYRTLKNQLSIGAVDATYVFSFDVQNGITGTKTDNVVTDASGRLPFRFDIGDLFTVGYNIAVTDDNKGISMATPVIEFGGETITATEGTTALTTGGGDSYGEFVTFKVTVNVDADGEDTITLEAYDRELNLNTIQSEEKVTITHNAELSGSVNYIAMGAPAGIGSNHRYQNIKIMGKSVPEEKDYAYSHLTVAEDVLQEAGGYTGSGTKWTGELTALYPATGVTGTGFETNWTASVDGKAKLDSKVTALRRGGTGFDDYIYTIQLDSTTQTIYRKLFTPIATKGKNGMYSFGFSVAEANGGYSSRSDVIFEIGNNLAVGYEWVEDMSASTPYAGKVKPFIEFNGGRTYSDATLTTFGGYDYYEFTSFNVNLTLNKDGNDLITLTVKDREINRTEYKKANEDATVTISAELTDSIEYVGFATTGDVRGKVLLTDVKIVGGEIPTITSSIYPMGTIAKDTLDDAAGYVIDKTTNRWDGNTPFKNHFPTDGSATKSGWANNWKGDAAGTTDINDGVVNYTQYTSKTIRFLSASAGSIYRKLSAPIATKDVEGTYIVNFATHECNSSYGARGGVDAYIGSGIKVGYDWPTTEALPEGYTKIDNEALMTPYIEVGGVKFTNGQLITHANDTNGEFVSFEVKIDLAKGNDVITLTAKDRAENNHATNVSGEVVEIKALTNIENPIDYIGFGGTTKLDVCDIAITGVNNAVINEKLAQKVYTLAEDNIHVADGYNDVKDDTDLPTAGYAVNNPGIGWAGKWLAKKSTETEYRDATSTDGLKLTRGALYPDAEKQAAATGYKMFHMLKTVGVPKTLSFYRQLADNINFNLDGKYVFEFDVMEGNTQVASRFPFRYYADEAFYVGHDRDTTGEYIYPLIGFAGADGKFNTADDIITKSETSLKTGGGDNTGKGEFVHYEATVVTDANGADYVVLKVQDRQEYQYNFDNVTNDVVTIAASADISGTCSYIGFGTTDENSFAARLQNFKVSGSKISSDTTAIEEADTAIVAYDSVDSNSYKSGNLSDAASYKAGTNTGFGWANGWSSTGASYTAPVEADKITAYSMGVYATKADEDASASITQTMLKLEGSGVIAYRQLKAPIKLSTTADEKYVFSVDVMDGISSAASRTGYGFRYYIGDNIYVGYNRNADNTKIIPYIGIGDEIEEADEEFTMAGGESGAGEFVTFEVTVINDADATDKVVLKVQDRQINHLSFDNVDTEELVTVEANANVSGSTIGYIGAGAPGATNSTSVRLQNFVVEGTAPVGVDKLDEIYTLSVASEDFSTGYKTSGNLGSAYDEGVTATGSGWGSLWSTSATEYVAPVADNKIEYYPEGSIKAIRFNDSPAGTKLYRPLAGVIDLGGEQDNKFVFKTEVMDGITTATSRKPFRFLIGDLFYTGHNRDATGENIYPVIGFAGADGLFDTADDVIFVSDESMPFAGGGAASEYIAYEVKVLTDVDGADYINVTVTVTESVSISARAELSDKKVNYIGLGSADNKGPNFRFRSFEVEASTYDRTASETIINQYKADMAKGYEGARILDTVTDEYARSELMAEFNKYGYAYEDFGGYDVATGIAPSSLNRGAGWDGAWSGENVEIAAGRDSTAGNDLRDIATNLSRKLKNPIDLSVDGGEYYVKVKAYVDIESANIKNHNLVIKAGDFAFGTVGSYNENGTDSATKYLVTPSFGTGTTAIIEGASTYPARNYNTYLLRIVSSAAGVDKLEYFFAPDGVPSKAVATAEVISDAKIDTISITDGANATLRINEVAVDCWNDSITAKRLSDYEYGILDGKDSQKYPYYSLYQKAMEENDVQLPDCVTTDYKLATSDRGFLGIIVADQKLEIGSGNSFFEIEDIAEMGKYSDIRNVRITTVYENTGVYEYKEGVEQPWYAIQGFVSFLYDGKLIAVKRAPIQVEPGTPKTATYTYSFPEEDGWDDEIDYTKLEIKVYSFEFHTFKPVEFAHIFNNTKTVFEGAEAELMYVNSAYAGDNGASDGSSDKPYVTLDEANDAIKAKIDAGEYPAGGVTVSVAGDHVYSGSNYFAPTVSGNALAPVVFDGQDNARIVGGITATLGGENPNFEPTESGDLIYGAGIYKYVVPEDVFKFTMDYPLGGHARGYSESLLTDKNNIGYYTLFFNDEMQTLSRWPNGGFAYVKEVKSWQNITADPDVENSTYGTDGIKFSVTDTYGGEAVVDTSKWSDDPDLAVHGYFSVDYSDLATGASITDDGYILTKYNCGKNAEDNKGTRRVIILNSPDELDAPGEWYIDKDTNTVYFMPPEGKTEGSIIIGTSTLPILRTNGSNYVTFKDLKIIGGLNQGISLNNGNGLVVDNCDITGAGGYGVITSGVRNAKIINSRVSFTGRGGISIGGGSFADNLKGNNVVENNIVNDYSQRMWTYSPAVSLGGYGNTVTKNTIYNSPHMAINLSGNDNVISYNNIYAVLKETSDMGAIYGGKNKSHRGNEIINNYFHDLVSDTKIGDGKDIMAIFMDDVMDGFIVKNNVFKDIKGGGFRANGGRLTDIQNNLFVKVATYNVALSRNSQVEDKNSTITEDGEVIDNPNYNRYWTYVYNDTVVANIMDGKSVSSRYGKYDHILDLATNSIRPLEPAYHTFKNNDKVGGGLDLRVSGNYLMADGKTTVTFGENNSKTLSAETLREYMTTKLGCDFVDSTILNEEPADYTKYIGTASLSGIGAQQQK